MTSTQMDALEVPPQGLALAEQAREHYERAIQAQRDGNWSLYGDEVTRLGEILERLTASQ